MMLIKYVPCKYRHCYHEQTGVGSFKCCRCGTVKYDTISIYRRVL